MESIRRVAVLSDIHGVLPALEAVLAEADVMGVDRIVVTGDIAAGPQPDEVLDALVALGDRVVLVRGNADRELAAMAADSALDLGDPVSTWAARQLSATHVDLLAGLPHPVLLEVGGFGPTVFCHGSPRDDEEVLLVDTAVDRWAEAFSGLDASVRTVVCGHTHMPFVRLVDRRLVVNPGSLGMPYGGAGARWALLDDGEVTLRTTRFDVAAAVERIVAESRFPDRRGWAEYALPSVASDAEVLAEWAHRDGRFGPDEADVLDDLRDLEPMLHRLPEGAGAADVEALLAADFTETGASGRRSDRATVVETVVARLANPRPEGWIIGDFAVARLGGAAWFATYHLDQDGRGTRRATVWRFEHGRWVAAYHQGTLR